MEKDQKNPEPQINASINSFRSSDEPKSAHSTPIVEKYVKKRRAKAEKQVDDEHKIESFWGTIKYVIL